MQHPSFVDPSILDQVKVGRDYVAAKFGFRNHWYPVLLSEDVREGEPVTAQVCGEKILLNRIDGTVFAIKDQCLHKGVPFSRKIECYTKDTITCWYHGFTYRFDDGVLCAVLASPESNVIGRRRLKTYPVEEAKGAIFVFVGDEDFPVPPLSHDVPPGFLDDGVAVRGRRQDVAANWRIGCENGFDSTHIFIHKDSILIEDADLALPLGITPTPGSDFEVCETEDGPKGVLHAFSPDAAIPVFEGKIDGEIVVSGAPRGSNLVPQAISMWLPCALKVDPWPVPNLTQFEWYVPIDGERHIYFQFLAAKVADVEEEATFDREFRERWVDTALIGFNQDDIWAREASQAFYADDTGWLREQLFEADANVVRWRDLASRLRRGVQAPQHVR